MSELHAVQETRGSKCVSIWEKQSGGLFRSECSIAPPIRQLVSQCGRQIAAPTIMSWGPQKGFCLFGERRHYEMRAGWILLEIRHKQYEVNVDEVGADSIRPPYCAKPPRANHNNTKKHRSLERCFLHILRAYLTRTARAAV